jgi:hypothetical protein
MSEIKVTGAPTVYPSGTKRDNRAGKGRYVLIPARALRRVALHYQKGGALYGENDWRKGMPFSDLLDSGIRHCFDRGQGKTDEDHLAAAVWNLLNLMDEEERIKEGHLPAELDDLLEIHE